MDKGMHLEDIPVGTRLEMTWIRESDLNNPQKADDPVQISQLLEPADGNILLIAVPIRGFRHIEWPADFYALVSFVQPDACAWTFTARLLETLEVDRINAFRVETVSPLTRCQRRAWFRLPCALDITLSVPIEKKTDLQKPSPPLTVRGITRDISGGGTAFVTSQPVPDVAHEVEMTLRLGPDNTISARGRIIRVGDIDGQPGRHQVSLQFTEIEKHDQDNLARFVLQQQRQNLRRK